MFGSTVAVDIDASVSDLMDVLVDNKCENCLLSYHGRYGNMLVFDLIYQVELSHEKIT